MGPKQHQPNDRADDDSAKSKFSTPTTQSAESQRRKDKKTNPPHDERDTMPEDLPLEVPMRHIEQ